MRHAHPARIAIRYSRRGRGIQSKPGFSPTPRSRRWSLIGMNRGRSLVEQYRSRRAIFGWTRLLFITAAGRRRLGRIGAERLHVAGKLPDLLGRHLAAECRHAMRPAVPDRCEDRHHFRTVIPPAVKKGRSGPASAIPVTGPAAKPRIEPLALAQVVGVGLIGLVESKIDLRRSAADTIRHQCDLVERLTDRRIEPKLALLSLASGQQQREANEHDSGPHDWSVLNSLRTNPPIQLVEDGSSRGRGRALDKEKIGAATADPVDPWTRPRRRQGAG